MSNPPPTEPLGWAGLISAVVVAVAGAVRLLLRGRLAPRTPSPDPVARFDTLTARLQAHMDGLEAENRQLRLDMDNQERQCGEQLAVMGRELGELRAQVAQLTLVLARHGITDGGAGHD